MGNDVSLTGEDLGVVSNDHMGLSIADDVRILANPRVVASAMGAGDGTGTPRLFGVDNGGGADGSIARNEVGASNLGGGGNGRRHSERRGEERQSTAERGRGDSGCGRDGTLDRGGEARGSEARGASRSAPRREP